MTDRAELVEKVAKAICSSDAKQHNTLETVWKIYKLDAEAAIDIVLEEAASAVAYLRWQEVDPFDDRTLAAAVNAIRALKSSA